MVRPKFNRWRASLLLQSSTLTSHHLIALHISVSKNSTTSLLIPEYSQRHVSPSSVGIPISILYGPLLTGFSDLVMCRKQAGISIGRLCDKCDGKCPVCDSYVRPTTLARICDECSFGNYQNKCVVCGGEGISDAFYCFECTRLEKDRDGCPKIINLGSSRTDLFYQKKNFRNH